MEESITVTRSVSVTPWIKGTVKWFDTIKGYGFIKTRVEDKYNVEAFLHKQLLFDQGFTGNLPKEAEVEIRCEKNKGRYRVAQIRKPQP